MKKATASIVAARACRDVHVPGSRRYADPASFLLTPQQWEPRRLEFCHLVGKPASAAALAVAGDELHVALSDLESQLARGGGPGQVRLTGDGLPVPTQPPDDASPNALAGADGDLGPGAEVDAVAVV